MSLVLPKAILQSIHANGERAYPEEGAGLLLGQLVKDLKEVSAILPVTNAREGGARHNRYLLTARDYMNGEMEAAKLGLDVLGVFHSHPDHPSQPSEFDREWALPWFSYLITSVRDGKAADSHSWVLSEDRGVFSEEVIEIKG